MVTDSDSGKDLGGRQKVDVSESLDSMEVDTGSKGSENTQKDGAGDTVSSDVNVSDTASGQSSSEKGNSEDKERIENLEKQIEQANDKYFRLFAEFENVRKRHQRQMIEHRDRANEELFLDMIPILQDFKKALEVKDQQEVNTLREGFGLIQSKLKKTLHSHKLESIDVASGHDFTTDLHEALTRMDAKEEMKGKVVALVEDGYMIGEKVIKHAKVVVGV